MYVKSDKYINRVLCGQNNCYRLEFIKMYDVPILKYMNGSHLKS